MLDLYAEYLISSFSYTTATGLSEMTEGQISHDRVSRFLNEDVCTGKMLWKIVKPIIRKLESEAGFVVFDDTIEEKPYTDENEIVAWHQCCLPINYDIVSKTKIIIDEKTGKEKRISEETKNEKYRRMLGQIVKNGIKFRYVLNDVWYASAEHMVYVKETIKNTGTQERNRAGSLFGRCYISHTALQTDIQKRRWYDRRTLLGQQQ